MTSDLSIALAQLNPTVGDVDGNIALIREARDRAKQDGADLVVTGELLVSGYPPEDLVLKPAFLDRVEEKVNALATETAEGGPALLIGAPWREDGKLYNAVLLLDQGKIATIRFKHLLPTYGVFDEDRVFDRGPVPGPIAFKGIKLGVMICEDMWNGDVTECLDESGAEILIVLNGSPFEVDKTDQRLNLAVARVSESGLPLVYVNLVGGQDELVFDGGSFVLGADRQLPIQLPGFAKGQVTSNWSKSDQGWVCAPGEIAETPDDNEKMLASIYQAMVLGLRDYVNKNRFPGVILGLSGGIDSGLSAAVAVDAIGADKVHCVMMPSPYTSQDSLDDAAEQAEILGIAYDTVPIIDAMKAFEGMLAPVFGDTEADTTEENIQARARGLIVMAISNKLGFMPLTTGNKSEMSVGYATLYGDMCGGYSVLKDVYKTTVFNVSHWRNENFVEDFLGPQGRAIPERVITKKPSAELKPDQFDEDSLPPYDVLDDILMSLIEGERAVRDIVAKGHDPAIVRRVWHMLDRAEYKRRQAPPGVKISSRAFGRDRRYPITNGFTNLMWEIEGE
ncbi:MAG: NAD+ synthase [Rhodospirillaceae bacterium]|jgi:NAD+ synthase|nr:NAD+ synthase [Rhodospirillaceae bacterium]MBT4589462.1 NAD+ synthase [Rhodospirillaceae bacterium]MBT7267077.1 NAD+ synthase [Rhodospirillaceae bacterium]